MEVAAAEGTAAEAQQDDTGDEEVAPLLSQTEESSEEEQKPAVGETHVLKMLYKGNMEEVNRRMEQERKAKVFNHKHCFYRNTRCASAAQEEQSALPAGVLNVHEDSTDDEGYVGEQKAMCGIKKCPVMFALLFSRRSAAPG